MNDDDGGGLHLRARLLAALPDAAVIARAPGRVELLRDPDAVLAIALPTGVWVAAAPRRDGLLHIRSLDAARHPEEIVCVPDLAPTGGGRPPRGFWSDHVVAAARELLPDRAGATGFELVVGADLPASAGLAASSALVGATFLALATAAELGDRPALAARAAAAERFVDPGGDHRLEHTIALHARAGHALRVGRQDLAIEAIPWPAGLALLLVDVDPVALPAGGRRVPAAGAAPLVDGAARALERADLAAFGALLEAWEPPAAAAAFGVLGVRRLGPRLLIACPAAAVTALIEVFGGTARARRVRPGAAAGWLAVRGTSAAPGRRADRGPRG